MSRNMFPHPSSWAGAHTMADTPLERGVLSPNRGTLRLDMVYVQEIIRGYRSGFGLGGGKTLEVARPALGVISTRRRKLADRCGVQIMRLRSMTSIDVVMEAQWVIYKRST